MKIPETGRVREEIFEALGRYKKNDMDWQSGRAFGYIFDPGKEILSFAKEVYNLFLSENALDFTVYPSLLQIENELVSMMRKHLQGDQEVVGNFTSGGTESILLAVKAARDYFRMKRPDITTPEMVVPTTAHAAFHKAAHYFGIKTVTVSVDSKTFTADPDRMAAHITDNTIFMAGSAPSYTQGVIDPIAALARTAQKHGIWFHTDACMGGFLLPYFKRLGREIPAFDFSLEGVSSISMDLHKYAYAPKGASMILYRNPELRACQMFAFTRWLGYTMINPTVQSTKSGGPMAAAWAVLNYVGDRQYLVFAEKQLFAVEAIKKGIASIPELYLLAEPEMTLLSFGSESVNIFHIIDEMNLKGWYIQPSLSFDGVPANIHLSVTLSNVAHTDRFVADLKQSVADAKKLPSGELLPIVRQIMEKEGEAILDDPLPLFALVGIQGGRMPKRMASVNEVLDALPPLWREKILLQVTNAFFHPEN